MPTFPDINDGLRADILLKDHDDHTLEDALLPPTPPYLPNESSKEYPSYEVIAGVIYLLIILYAFYTPPVFVYLKHHHILKDVCGRQNLNLPPLIGLDLWLEKPFWILSADHQEFLMTALNFSDDHR